MTSINDTILESNRNFRLNFDGGDLSSDAGLLLLNEFISKMGFDKTLGETFQTNDTAKWRWHTDGQNLMQMIFQIFSAYFTDDCADELTEDPVFAAILRLRQQPPRGGERKPLPDTRAGLQPVQLVQAARASGTNA